MNPRIEIISQVQDRVGESPLWDGSADTLYWVDSLAGRVRSLRPSDGLERQWQLPSTVGSIALAEPGHLLVALCDGFYSLDLSRGAVEAIALPEPPDGPSRFNDGRMDRYGRFLSGTMRNDPADGAVGKLYRLDGRGHVDVLETGVEISNALCFAPDDRTLYFADSLKGVIWAYDYDGPSGRVGRRRVFCDVRALTGSGPDGAVTDTEGGLWVALPQAGRVARLAPDGSLDLQFDAPSPHPSCPAFGGADLDVLYLTSISDSGPRMRTDHPEAGKLVAVKGLGARGVPEPRFSLSGLRRRPSAGG